MNNLQITYHLLQGEVLHQASHFLSSDEQQMLHTKTCHGFAALHEQKVIGLALFQLHGNRMILDRIFVDPRFRLFDVGTGMMRSLCALAETHHLDLLFSFEAEGIRDGFYRFVAATRRFTIQRQEGYSALLSVEELENLCKKYPPGMKTHEHFFDLNHVMQEAFISHLQESYPDIARELRFHHEDYRSDLCFCIVSGGQVQAGCFVKEHEDKLELKLLYSLPGRGVLAGKVLLDAISELGRNKILKPVRITLVGTSATKVMEGLCPSVYKEKYIYTAYYTGKPT